ncbi:CBS domain-containing protein [Thalassotalea agarivorans]|uniref:CBS domain-containing protein n=1 Tax=Thalassotalea agarivorans TaxID=349064 RepID=A0A1I0EY47_THASX|nr:CBS domain-containing protein [Thalassotalea agarivorans]SET50084.1 CBS domain-containing protein [Thalassotalea agarivorans]
MESIQVKDYLNQYPVTFTPEMGVAEASLRFLKTKQIGGPVIDSDNKLVGFLSESDVLKAMLATIYHNEHTATVADVMFSEALSVKPYDSIVELAQSMLENKPKVYPVVDDAGLLVGTISRNDVLMAIDKHMRQNNFQP